MEILEISKTENEGKFKRYLENLLKDSKNTGNIFIWGDKNEVFVDSPYTFEFMAKEAGVKNFFTRNGLLNYFKKIGGECWNIWLSSRSTDEFMNKYGENYHIK